MLRHVVYASLLHFGVEFGGVFAQCLRRSHQRFRSAPGDDDLGAFTLEFLSGREPDTAAATGDDNDFVHEPAHLTSSSST